MGARQSLAFALAMMLSVASCYAQDGSEQDEYPHHSPEMPADNSTGPSSSPQNDTSSEAEHVPPEPPQHAMEQMSYDQMAKMMQMDDRERVGRVLIDQLEWRTGQGSDAGVWEAEAWYGGDYNKLWFRTEGERVQDTTEDARAELFWDRIFARWWSLQAGVRRDLGGGPSRNWAAFGVQGIAPYWFDVEATAYAGEEGRTAARFRAEYDLLFTQRLILQPEAEVNLYGKADPDRGIGSGLSDLDLGLRLRYEFRRELAPYIGVAWHKLFGGTADQARAAGKSTSDVQLTVGLRAWF